MGRGLKLPGSVHHIYDYLCVQTESCGFNKATTLCLHFIYNKSLMELLSKMRKMRTITPLDATYIESKIFNCFDV